MEMVGVGEPQSVSDEPALEAVDFILVNKACRDKRRGKTMLFYPPPCSV